MIGLKYICEEFNYSYTDVAKELGINPQNIYDWINIKNGKPKRKIPEKRLKQLSKLFGVPEEYFSKELTPSEQLRVQAIHLNQTDVGHEIPVFDNEGNEVGTTTYWEHANIIGTLSGEADRLESNEKLLKRIEALMANGDVNPYETDDSALTNYGVFSTVVRTLTAYKYEQRQALEIILNLMDLDNYQVEDDILLGFYSTDFVSRYVPKGQEKLAKDLLKVFFDHGIFEKPNLKKYMGEN